MEKVKRMADGKVVLEGVIYDTSISKRINVTNQNTGNKISSISIDNVAYYPIGVVKEKKTKEKMATNNTQVSYSDYVRKFWKLFGYTFGGILLFFLLASWGFFGKMPSFDELENPDTNIATEIISSDGVTLGKFYKENRFFQSTEIIPDGD